VRPTSFVKIDNFYTATVYDKGAEVIRMLKTLLGPEDFRRGMDLYFQRHDGEATTVEAFVACFADASGRDLAPFFGWYSQAGTPQVTLRADYDAKAKTLELSLGQVTAPTPGQPDKRPLPIPLRIGLLDADGKPLTFRLSDADASVADTVIVLDQAERKLRLTGVERPPVVSALRQFSAPVKLESGAKPEDDYVLLAGDPDLFNRWEAGQRLAKALILNRAAGKPDEAGEARFAAALGRALGDQSSEHAFKALLLALPGEQDLSLAVTAADPAAIHGAREALRARLASDLAANLQRMHDELDGPRAFSPDAESAGRRALRNAALDLLAASPTPATVERARTHYRRADNMTDAMGGLSALVLLGGEACDQALTDFYARWEAEPLVIDKWFSVQARSPAPDALGRVLGLTAHPAFDPKNPNRLRALVAVFATANPYRFHDPSGAGYRFLADQILATDGFNPMIAARLVEPLGAWRRFRPELGALMKAELERIAAAPGLSKNVSELVTRALA
jgi:aminopeptidase N